MAFFSPNAAWKSRIIKWADASAAALFEFRVTI
jgi:hypothetical protein